jgi:arylsulfatase
LVPSTGRTGEALTRGGLSTKLEALIKQEIGVDDGREMPPLAGVNWTIDVKGNQAILD